MTRTIGLIAYTGTFAACMIRWVRARQTGIRVGIFPLLAALQLALLLDMVFNWRWLVHEYGMREAMAHGVYGERRGPQLWLLIGLLFILAAGAAIVLMQYRRHKGRALALIGTILSVGLCLGEAVSYHDADRVLHATVGGAMIVSILWCLLCMLTCLGLWIDARQTWAEFRD